MTLGELIKEIENITQSPISSMVQNQINKFQRDGYSYLDIYKCFYYFYIIKQNDISKIQQFGIGIIPSIRNEAYIYYNKIEQKKQIQINAAKQVLNDGIKEVSYSPSRRIFNKGGIDINEL